MECGDSVTYLEFCDVGADGVDGTGYVVALV
jgi:hypothetical protein